MTLYTPRLTLCAFQPCDWPFFLQLRTHDRVMRYMGDIASEEQIHTLFESRLADRHAFIIRNAQAAVGDIGLRISQHNPQEADVGYSIAPAAQGQGVASEALQALCEYAFSESDVQALNAWVLAENHGSVRVLEKSGFQRVQILEKAYLLHGEYHDDWVFRREKA